jgi:ATP-dependent RNA helicase DeaD
MLRESRIAARWSAVPSPEEIRARDAERLSAEVAALASDAADEDRDAAARLLAAHDPLLLAIALVRRERARLPAPEEVPETARAGREAPVAAGAKRAPRRAPPADVVWFRVSLGRERKADPRWLLPLLCRRGGVTRDRIGKIEVLPRETRFEVARDAAAAFAKAAGRPDPRMPDARIEPVRGAAPPSRRPERGPQRR